VWLDRPLNCASEPLDESPPVVGPIDLNVSADELVFDVLLAGCLALAAMTVGVMAAFGLVFVPPGSPFDLLVVGGARSF
jgi:hypothetical protein